MTNRLIHETSPYLLQHAENPVDWHAWSEEAFTRAREADVPVFLSIGYSACHWCHVMAHESFEDPSTAEYMNHNFINIKVDREERPDVDAIYMNAVVAMTGQGGWPMSVFLTPDGIPFYGGTYFPPQPRYGMPSFMEVLKHVTRLWKDDREQLLAYGSKLQGHVAARPTLLSTDHAINPETFVQASKMLFESYDWQAGGWGGAPKFPQPAVIEFLFRHHNRSGDQLAMDMARHALHRMANGGMYDMIGGGFHRYSVDKDWLIPHFEKMLYDNATLGRIYIQAWLVCGDPAFRSIAEHTLDFLQRELRDPLGGFYASLDADSEGVEGKFYTWSLEQIHATLQDEQPSDLVIEAYGMTEEGNFEGVNIPFLNAKTELLAEQFGTQPEAIERRLAEANAKLLDARHARVRPALDDKILAAWNGLLLDTLAVAAQALDRERYLPLAHDLATFLLENMMIDDRLKRSWRQGEARFDAYLEDYAAIGQGLLSLYETDFDTRWYRAAITCADHILAAFADSEGGFFDTADDHEQLISRPKNIQDSPTPSGNSLAASLLIRLGAMTGDEHYSEPGRKMLIAMQENAGKHPTSFAHWLNQMDYVLGPQLQLAIMGDVESEEFQALAQVAWRGFYPRLVLAGETSGTADDPELLRGRSMQNGVATAYLCQGFTCQLPTTSADVLKEQLDQASGK